MKTIEITPFVPPYVKGDTGEKKGTPERKAGEWRERGTADEEGSFWHSDLNCRVDLGIWIC
jgi:hypothetical protein